VTDAAVTWRPAGPDRLPGEGLRERKKRLLRQQLSSTATVMFMERGFEAVRVAEIAEACGVSEKTVFNYFPTKESLLLDRPDETSTALLAALRAPEAEPLDAALRVLDDELGALTAWLTHQGDPAEAAATLRRFRELSSSTPGLRAYQYEMADRLATEVAGVLATRAGVDPADPRPLIAAIALTGLWRVQAAGLARHLTGRHAPEEVRGRVAEEVREAAKLVEPTVRALDGLRHRQLRGRV
jgi:AcrR family transcriptional regulator